jgi:hypothetical protein
MSLIHLEGYCEPEAKTAKPIAVKATSDANEIIRMIRKVLVLRIYIYKRLIFPQIKAYRRKNTHSKGVGEYRAR